MKIQCTKGTIDQMINQFKGRIEELQGPVDIESASRILPDGTEYDPEDYEGGYTEWTKVASKPVRDYDGFITEYTMWYNEFEDKYVFVFGDSDIYYPENADWDWECESNEEATEWYNDYEGFEDVEESERINCSEESQNATWIVQKMYQKFPYIDFIDERDIGSKVALFFKLKEPVSDLEDWLHSEGIDYKIKDGKLRIIADEDFEDDEVEGCEVTGSSNSWMTTARKLGYSIQELIQMYNDETGKSADKNSKEFQNWCKNYFKDDVKCINCSETEEQPYIVRFGWDSGGPENGPSYGYGEDIVYALSKEDACSKWEAENQDQIAGLNSGRYGGYEGCFARPATEDDIREYEEEQKRWEELEKYYDFVDGDVFPKESVESAEFMDLGTGLNYWYFTTHGVQPGSVPKGLEILEIRDTPNGTYFLTNRVLTTDSLKYYDIKERSPKDEVKAWYVGEPDSGAELASAYRFKAIINSPDFSDRLDNVVDRYNVSQPVSGDWSTELRSEQKAIADEFGISMLQARKIMVDKLGFDYSDFKEV